MTFLPIVERELRVAARQRGTYFTRLGAVVAGLAVGSWIMLIPFIRNSRELGIALFSSLAVVTFVYSLLIGIRTTADCLSEEKREGTLGLLFLTDLRGYDIVFGKLAATSVNAFYGMVAVFPILAISLLAGGVTGAEFGRVVGTCINNVFFSLAVGLFASAVSRDERKAMGLALGIILLLAAGLPAIFAIIVETRNIQRPDPEWLIPSPAFTCFMAFDKISRGAGGSGLFYASLAAVHAMGWAFLLLACWIVPRTWHDKVEGVDRSPVARRWRQIVFGTPEQRLALRRMLLAINPVYWLTSRDRVKTYLVWLFLLLIAALWAWGLWKYPNIWKDDSTYVMTMLLAHTVLKIWLTTEGARQFGFDRRSGALELLLSTPLNVPQIIRGQLLSLWRQFAAPAAIVLVADLVFMAALNDQDSTVKLFWVVIIVVFVADLVTLSWVSMWLGLCHKSSSRASAGTLARILVLPWGVFFVLLMTLSFGGFGRSSLANDEDGMIVMGLMIALIIDLAFGLWARNRLVGEMRQVATQRFEVRREEHPAPALRSPPPKPAVGPA